MWKRDPHPLFHISEKLPIYIFPVTNVNQDHLHSVVQFALRTPFLTKIWAITQHNQGDNHHKSFNFCVLCQYFCGIFDKIMRSFNLQLRNVLKTIKKIQGKYKYKIDFGKYQPEYIFLYVDMETGANLLATSTCGSRPKPSTGSTGSKPPTRTHPPVIRIFPSWKTILYFSQFKRHSQPNQKKTSQTKRSKKHPPVCTHPQVGILPAFKK